MTKRAAKKTPAKSSSPSKSSKRATKKASASSKGGAKASSAGKKAEATLQPVSKRKRLDPKQDPRPASSARSLGLRGAAPWVARHAAKRADELRARNSTPAPEGSARATLRTPERAEELKNQIAELHQRVSEIKTMRKKLDSTFYEVGLVLSEIHLKELFVAKGFSSFEAFVDRELGLPRGVALKLLRIAETFQREAAYDFGLDRLVAALAALDGAVVTAPTSQPSRPSSQGFGRAALRWDD